MIALITRTAAYGLIAYAWLRLYPFVAAMRWRDGWMLFTKSNTYWLGPGE